MGFWSNILNRWNNIFKAKANVITEENEKKNALDLYKLKVKEFESNIAKARNGVATTEAELKIQLAKAKELEASYLKSQEHAKIAYTRYMELDENNPSKREYYELSEEALHKKNICKQEAETLFNTCVVLKQTIDEDKKMLKLLMNELESYRVKQSQLESSIQISKAKRQLADSFSGISEDNSLSLKQLEDTIRRDEAHATALSDAALDDKKRDMRFKELEAEYEVSNEMKELEQTILKEKEEKVKVIQNEQIKAISQKSKVLELPSEKIDKKKEQLNNFFGENNKKEKIDKFFNK